MNTPAVPNETPFTVILPSKYPNPAIKNTQKTKKLIVLIERMPPKSTIIKTSKNLLHKKCSFNSYYYYKEKRVNREYVLENSELGMKNYELRKFRIQNSEFRETLIAMGKIWEL